VLLSADALTVTKDSGAGNQIQCFLNSDRSQCYTRTTQVNTEISNSIGTTLNLDKQIRHIKVLMIFTRNNS
jgi:translation elongation factor EF-Tu-like GTPase